jgi:hypothetical protein
VNDARGTPSDTRSRRARSRARSTGLALSTPSSVGSRVSLLELGVQPLEALRVHQQLGHAAEKRHRHEHDHAEGQRVFALIEGGRARQDHGAQGAGDEDGNASHVRFSECAVPAVCGAGLPARAALSTSARSPDASSS